jgi:hypothetical protein
MTHTSFLGRHKTLVLTQNEGTATHHKFLFGEAQTNIIRPKGSAIMSYTHFHSQKYSYGMKFCIYTPENKGAL